MATQFEKEIENLEKENEQLRQQYAELQNKWNLVYNGMAVLTCLSQEAKQRLNHHDVGDVLDALNRASKRFEL